MTALEVFTQNDGKVTKAYYAQLEERGPIGQIAMNLFRAQKRSTAAKNYRGRRFKSAAYDVKNWSIEQLCRILQEHGASRGIAFGWKEDPYTPGFEWVLYVDLPQGQVSFHSSRRGVGPDYPGDWDRQRLSRERILAFCDNVLNAKPLSVEQRVTHAYALGPDDANGQPTGRYLGAFVSEPFQGLARNDKPAEQVSLFPNVRKDD